MISRYPRSGEVQPLPIKGTVRFIGRAIHLAIAGGRDGVSHLERTDGRYNRR